MQILVPKVPLEVQKNRHFFVNHVYYHVGPWVIGAIIGQRSHGDLTGTVKTCR